jgi:hypothetical protein
MLLTSAVAKLSGSPVTPYPQHGWLTHPTARLLVVEWECVLGVWLLSGVGRTAAWAAAGATFAAFAWVSAATGLAGQASCGCFGAVPTSPWVVFGLDLVVLVSLLIVRPPLGAVRAGLPRLLSVRATAAAALVAAALLGVASSRVGDRVRVGLHGGVVTVEQAVVEFGTHRPGEARFAPVTLTNHSDRPVRLVGGTIDCFCDVTPDLPLRLEPGERGTFRVRVNPSSGSGLYQRPVHVWTDHPAAPVLWLTLSGRLAGD